MAKLKKGDDPVQALTNLQSLMAQAFTDVKMLKTLDNKKAVLKQADKAYDEVMGSLSAAYKRNKASPEIVAQVDSLKDGLRQQHQKIKAMLEDYAIQQGPQSPRSASPVLQKQITKEQYQKVIGELKSHQEALEIKRCCKYIYNKHQAIIEKFEQNISELNHPTKRGKETAKRLLDTLKQYLNDYLKKYKDQKDTIISKETFRQNMKDYSGLIRTAINQAKPILAKDLGWGDYLTNMLKELANAIRGAFGYSSDFFKPKKADSLGHVEAAKEKIFKPRKP